MEWQPIETAPKDGTEFLASNEKYIGIGYFYHRVEPDYIINRDKWQEFYRKVREPFEPKFTSNNLFEPGYNYVEQMKAADVAWERVKHNSPPLEKVSNPKAGEVSEWYAASAFYSFDGSDITDDDRDPLFFTPTHWMPLPPPPSENP